MFVWLLASLSGGIAKSLEKWSNFPAVEHEYQVHVSEFWMTACLEAWCSHAILYFILKAEPGRSFGRTGVCSVSRAIQKKSSSRRLPTCEPTERSHQRQHEGPGQKKILGKTRCSL